MDAYGTTLRSASAVPGTLRCDRINLNEPAIINCLLEVLEAAAGKPSSWSMLEVSGRYYFSTPGRGLPAVGGWYIICDETRRPLYVGTAENLKNRLNSRDGSRDNFANPKRSQDSVRNFVKAFHSTGILPELQVLVVPEQSVCDRLGVPSPLSDLDRGNVEKVLGLFRERIVGSS